MNNLLPVFMKLEGQPCLVVGGGKIAYQKIQQLLDSKAHVTVIAPGIHESIQSLSVEVIKRKYKREDSKSYQLIIAATDDMKVNSQIYHDASERGIPINVVDQPKICSFYMGSVYQDGDVKIAVSTNGKCPTFGRFLRDHIQNISRGLWGKNLGQLALKREKIIKALSTYSKKKEVMEKFIKRRCQNISKTQPARGKVFLVGAGPGDPELITVKGLQAIQRADVIVYDALIHPHLVFEINPLAKKIFVGKREDKHSVSQETIHMILTEEAQKGRQVVRLKGGDPFIFGRGGEEAMALAKEDIPFEAVPGVTAGIGAAAGFGIPLTHRGQANSTLFVTGHQCSWADSQDWETLAKLDSTLVFYMGMKRLNKIVRGLIENGKSIETPIAIIQNATMINQAILTSTLESIFTDIKKMTSRTPSIIIIGEVVSNYTKFQECLDTLPSQKTAPMGDLGFDIWNNQSVTA